MKKRIIITGGNSGVGKALANEMCSKGHEIIIISKESEKTNTVINALTDEYGQQAVKLITADLSSPDDIKKAVSLLVDMDGVIDVLVNNAGILKLKKEFSVDNIEMTMSVNYLAVCRLTIGLLNAGKEIKRIVNVTSELFTKGALDLEDMINPKNFNGQQVYSNTKLANLALSADLFETYGEHIEVIAMHPGVVASNAFRDYPKLFMRFLNLFLEKPAKAAEKIGEIILSEQVKNGYYYSQNQARNEITTYLHQDDTKKLKAFSQKYL